jgi:hypothetical protein
MHGQRVVDFGTHALLLESLDDRISVRDANRILIENTDAIRANRGSLDSAGSKSLVVKRRMAAAPFRPIAEVGKLYKQDCRLNGIEPKIAADEFRSSQSSRRHRHRRGSCWGKS